MIMATKRAMATAVRAMATAMLAAIRVLGVGREL
jgi:hypothetical protein